ncbi:MAG: molybdenum cofactor biosynthesis protein MoaE [Planctomycetales bacterium]|nr:molybdenum cofactor biosynthesis protein MoaE [Planctomycetales bacterium]
MIDLTFTVIDTQSLTERVSSSSAGAVVLFIGTTREFTDGRQTESLEYECYEDMTRKTLADLEQQARDRWPIVECAIVHRLGHVPLAEASIAIAVSSPHRAAAFEAGRWLIDTIKEVVPIWKKEKWKDGTTEWVHPHPSPPAARSDIE